MSRACEICGRRLKTGTKYCYVCRSIQKAGGTKRKENNHLAWDIAITGVILFIISLFIKNEVWYIFGIIGGIVGFPLLLGLVIKVLSEKKKKEINN